MKELIKQESMNVWEDMNTTTIKIGDALLSFIGLILSLGASIFVVFSVGLMKLGCYVEDAQRWLVPNHPEQNKSIEVVPTDKAPQCGECGGVGGHTRACKVMKAAVAAGEKMPLWVEPPQLKAGKMWPVTKTE